ncbi:K02A2.6-like, partial [Cordylochernes scorpioides]
MWTGPRVISKTITVESIQELSEVLKRPPVIWDNIHANDYDQKRLFLGPYSGRSTDLRRHLRGVLTNPNCEYEMNFIPIHTFSQWNRCSADGTADHSRLPALSPQFKLLTSTFFLNTLSRLVCGLRKESLVKRLLSEAALTLEKAINIALCDESASANASVLMETTPDVNILKKANKGEPFNFKSKQAEFNRIAKGLNKKIICIRCKGNHLPHICKFRNSKCFKCGKIGHLQKACLTRVKKFEYLHRSNSDTYLHCLGAESLSNPFYIMVKLDNHDLSMLIDSGSSYSLLNKETFLKYWKVTQLEKSEVLLKTWSSSHVKILGKLFVKAKVTNGFKKLSILVADGLGPNILGRQWFVKQVFEQDIDAYNGPLIHIDIPENAEPKFVKARTMPFALRELVDKKLKSLEGQGVIEPVKFTKWASPIVTVLKNDGTIRICHDYKITVNLYSNPDKYPLLTIPQLLDRLRGGRVFTKLDMAQSYQQLKVDETSAEILAINTPRGLYKVKRLPFGLNSAVGTFQRFMDTLLSGIDGVAVYLDDVLISGRDCDDLKRKTEKVLLRFRESGLRLKREKCKFYVPEIEFLGMIIDHKGIRPSEGKLRAIKDAKPPSNKRELMSFLGLLNYYERFLNNKATVAEPLHRLLDSNNPWKWNKEHQRYFAEVKNLMSSKSVLAHFNEDLPILVNCDASEYGVGAIFSQIDHGIERPVVFASRTSNKTERRYAVIDREALAVIFAVSKFSQYLLGRKFKIVTDHKPLAGLFNPNKPIPQVLSPRMMRWCLTLSAYTYTIEYKPGNGNVDVLSRLPLNESPSQIPTHRRNINRIIISVQNDTVSADIKLEAEGETGSLEDIPSHLGPNAYHPKKALRLAINTWLPEFYRAKNAFGHVVSAPFVPAPIPGCPAPIITPCIPPPPTPNSAPSTVPNRLDGDDSAFPPLSTELVNSLVAPETSGEPMDCNPSFVESLAEVGEMKPADNDLAEIMQTEGESPPGEPDDGKQISYEDIATLVDLFYLPFEHGRQGMFVAQEFHWLKAHGHLVSEHRGKKDENPEVQEWYDRAAKFEQLARNIGKLLIKLNYCQNRSLLYDLYAYVWDIKGVISLLNSYIKWI